ncbi:TMEM175 family protein [Lacticaseibacillus baoqingensis]|uniref:TMEM175 family protein n=1 Tax=Lacticaseibacillus baoqingensis TaxID=2486013 RepID=A0ABW4E3C7_9LACO|nr:TMEM175 family protein [Lacticaseibacillus baoqingensis]
MEKLKNRLDAFSDAIIAIIITIMVLDIPPVLHDSWGNYWLLGKHIGIFLISFIFVANIWYQHSTAFGEITTMTYRVFIFDMIFLAFLSLIPIFTNMMAVNTTKTTVILYGCLQFVVNLLFRYLAKVIIHLQYTDKQAMQKVYTKIYGNANHILDILSIWDLIVAWFFPSIALAFYLAYPILTFLLNAQAHQEMYDVAELPEAQQQDVAAFNASELKDFRKAQQAILTQQAPDGKAGGAPQKAPSWTQWLDQSVDPRMRRRFLQHYGQVTPEQQAQLQQWVRQYKRGKRQARRPK